MTNCPNCSSSSRRKSRKGLKNKQSYGRFKAAFRCDDCGTRFIAPDPLQIALYSTYAISIVLFVGILWRGLAAPSSADRLAELRALEAAALPATSTASIDLGTARAMASANDTDPETNYRLALALIRDNKVNGDSSSLAEAVPILKEAAASGHAKAQSELGALYLDGRGVVQDFVQASAWYQKAADQGDADAMLALGRMYRAGWGMEADLVNAYIWLNLASARGQAAAQQARQEILSQLSAEELNEAQLASRELDRVLP